MKINNNNNNKDIEQDLMKTKQLWKNFTSFLNPVSVNFFCLGLKKKKN
jgi:hypothetical protein